MTEPMGLTPLISRRAVIAGSAAAAALALVSLERPRRANADELSLVAGPAAAPDRTAFAPEEQVLADYLVILAAMANDIVTDGSTRHGWMAGGWWRTPSEPFNARIQEHVATLAWFYASPRTWNPYYLDAALLARLDASIGYYLGLQHTDGSWPEYNATEQSRAATGFGLVALAETLALLESVDALPTRRTEIASALTAGAAWFLDTGNAANWGTSTTVLRFANQTMAGLAGCARAALVLGDSTMLDTVLDRIPLFAARAQAVGGWFYEPTGMDFGYSWGVQTPDMADLYRLTGASELVEMAEKWVAFMNLVAVREPDGIGFISMGSGSARTDGSIPIDDVVADRSDRTALANAFLADVPAIAAYRPTLESVNAGRVAWAASTDPIEGREKQNTSPRLWMHVTEAPQSPLGTTRNSRIAALPTLASDRFTAARTGVLGMQFVFARRPQYYLASLYGQRSSTKVRNGSQLLWHPDMGTVVVGFNDAAATNDFWGTVLAAGGDDARTTLTANYSAAGAPVPVTGLDAVTGDLVITATSTATGITTVTTIGDDGFRRAVTAPAAASEQIPLLLQPGDDLHWLGSKGRPVWGEAASVTATGLALKRNGCTAMFRWDVPSTTTITPTARTVFPGSGRRQHVLTVGHQGSFTLDVGFSC